MKRFIRQLEIKGMDAATIKQYRSSLKCFYEWMGANESKNPKESGGNIKPHATKGRNDLSNPIVNQMSKGTLNNPYITTNPIEGITQLDVENFKHYATVKWKPNTVRQRLTHLRVWFDFLVERGELIDNPSQHIDPVISGKLTPKWLKQSEQNQLIRFVRKYGNIREYAIVTLMLHTGLWVQEIVDLRMNDIELTERKGKIIVRRGKHNRYREIPLNVDARRVLEAYLGEKPATEFLFSSQRSEALSTRGVQHIFEKYKALTGIEHLSANALRHSFCHELVTQTGPQ